MTFKMWRKWRPKNVIYDLPGPELHFSTSQKLNLVQMDPKNLNITQKSSKIIEKPWPSKCEENGAQKI